LKEGGKEEAIVLAKERKDKKERNKKKKF